MRLRTATPADAPRLTGLVEAAYARYVERLGRPPRPMTEDNEEVVEQRAVTVAERDGSIIGLIVLGTDEEGFLVENVAVDPAEQGTGVGRLLLEHAEEEARRAGFASVHLYTPEQMTENLDLYERIGYEEFARRDAGAVRLVHLRKRLPVPPRR